ncbi:MAG TPA: small acid-soluble spore protein Tlp [Clostridia bacterium]|nr:small acid-soluble spore protein Tlp [Clostridia bacterium]
MSPKPDDRKDNVKKIQRNIDNTNKNIEAAEEMISITEDPSVREDIKDKNERRREALDSMVTEIKDEAKDRRKRRD